jgi:hypothetical protein
VGVRFPLWRSVKGHSNWGFVGLRFCLLNNLCSTTQPDAGVLASLSPVPAKTNGKTHHFSIYLICGLFDTPENRVITSGLTLASILEAFLYPTGTKEPLNLAKAEAC